jgi:putative phosphoribosyl transferase
MIRVRDLRKTYLIVRRHLTMRLERIIWVVALLLVGGEDTEVIELNREAKARMRCLCEIAIVPGATHLFEEPGTLEAVAVAARDWFLRHL